MARLSLVFQRAIIDLSLILPMVESTVAFIERQLKEPDKMYDKVETRLQELRNSDLPIRNSSSARAQFDSSV